QARRRAGRFPPHALQVAAAPAIRSAGLWGEPPLAAAARRQREGAEAQEDDERMQGSADHASSAR
ncbi:MAG TPA: hypothetical protein VIJ05_10970, partial [Actinomycetes bacterium]